MKAKVAINGFGRIGRLMFRIAHNDPDLDIVAVNNPTENKTMGHLLKYDSNYGIFDAEVAAESPDILSVDGKKIKYFQEREPAKIPWKDVGVDIVLESSGVFRTTDTAGQHLTAGAKKVIITAPGKDPMPTFCVGVNETLYDPAKDNIISNASCTTNGMAPMVKVLHENLKIKKGLMTTIHAYTNDQNILDLPHKDLRRARAAAVSMIPTTTGAAKAIGEVIPDLKGKLNGFSVRVPTPTVSLIDLVCEVEKSTTVEEINSMLKKAAEGPLKNVMLFSDLPLVSIDYKGNSHSCIVDALSTMVIDGNMIKVVAWYDNEYGYSCRVIDMAKYMAGKM